MTTAASLAEITSLHARRKKEGPQPLNLPPLYGPVNPHEIHLTDDRNVFFRGLGINNQASEDIEEEPADADVNTSLLYIDDAYQDYLVYAINQSLFKTDLIEDKIAILTKMSRPFFQLAVLVTMLTPF